MGWTQGTSQDPKQNTRVVVLAALAGLVIMAGIGTLLTVALSEDEESSRKEIRQEFYRKQASDDQGGTGAGDVVYETDTIRIHGANNSSKNPPKQSISSPAPPPVDTAPAPILPEHGPLEAVPEKVPERKR